LKLNALLTLKQLEWYLNFSTWFKKKVFFGQKKVTWIY